MVLIYWIDMSIFNQVSFIIYMYFLPDSFGFEYICGVGFWCGGMLVIVIVVVVVAIVTVTAAVGIDRVTVK